MAEPGEQRVYFALSGEEVKIGVSNNPHKRIKGMQIARPDIKLLADIPGGIKTETHLHRRFQEFRITGEWFHFAPEIQEFVKEQLKRNAARKSELAPRDDELFDPDDLAKRWKCSEKAVQRIEKRFNLPACRIMRAVKYRLSDILRIEAEGLGQLPKRWTGLRPHEKAELLRREREEAAAPNSAPGQNG